MIFKIYLAVTLYGLPTLIFAASDGVVGATSTGTASVLMTIPKMIRARSFANFPMGNYNGNGNLNRNDNLRISTNYGTATRTYRVTASGSGTGSAFTITNGTTPLAYNAYFNDATGIVGRIALTATVPLTAQANASKPLSSNTNNANLSIEILQADLQSVDSGAYTGIITLVFAPE